ncbi:polysaccharide deacetylase family protein [Anaerolinea thermophila]|uniref:ChbG/HpnK family deacetylase n=1 Tax=Anaerolinea thermophila (strain DSM 14523 / JCM 11388 / NBRC 100420 / UNI-1) TaxID=926569 RepID=E8MY30_ANATU|nr:polysaccharide deacetylase family protein [Anaerolinea thermophila]BAJ64261.1 hypothetical protein ANT_22350 [Anaerolinea thermophila UNI-1]
MKPNPLLKKLGFSDSDRVVLIHADDVGMCQASVQAFADLTAFGLVSCGAVMVPCSWAPLAGAYAREHPEADLGVHLTLTSEWQNYRWGPLSTRDPRSGLLDEEGYFPRTVEPVQAKGNPRAVRREIEVQLEHARRLGINPSHVDTHMGTVIHPKFLDAYIGTARKNRLPAMIVRQDEASLRQMGLNALTAKIAARWIERLEREGFPMLDDIVMMPLGQWENRLEVAKEVFKAVKPGLTHFIIHPAVDSPEIRAIAPDWRARVADWQVFQSQELRQFLQAEGIQIIGYRAIQSLMR